MSYTLTQTSNEWDEIQERNIDLHSPVTSKNHNKLLKILGSSKLKIKGLELSYIRDTDRNAMLGRIQPGIVVVDYMVIEFLEESIIEIFSCPVSPATYNIVVEYTHGESLPPNVAIIKSIPSTSYDASIHLLLYTVDTQAWNIVPLIEDIVLPSIPPSEPIDIPDWILNAFVLKTGDTLTGPLNSPSPTESSELANKGYVDNLVDIVEENMANAYLPTTGGNMTGFINLHYQPIEDMHPVNKKYLLDTIAGINNDVPTTTYGFVKKTGDTMTGTLTVPAINASNKLSLKINNIEVGYIDEYGITGSLYNSDIVEFFEHAMTSMPPEGTCIVLNKKGKCIISTRENQTNVIGLVSYHPGFVLGGITDWKYMFESIGKIPIAIAGQIKNVKVYSNKEYDPGTLLVSYENGSLTPMEDFKPGAIVAKALNPINPGVNIIDVLINR